MLILISIFLAILFFYLLVLFFFFFFLTFLLLFLIGLLSINTDKVDVVVSEDIYFTVPKRKKNTIKAIIEYNGPIKAPIKKGEVIGKLNIYVLDELTKEIDLLSNEDIKRADVFSRLFKSINYLIWGDV